MEQGTTDNGVFGAKLMWQYLGDFVGLLRGIPDYRDLPLSELLPAAFPDLTFVRVVRANKIRQAVSLWKAVQTASWSDKGGDGAPTEEAPYRAYLEEHKPQLRFHYRAISHLLDQILAAEASWDAFFEHTRIKPILVLYENFYADYASSTVNILERLGLEPPADFVAGAADAAASPTASTTTGRGGSASCASGPGSTWFRHRAGRGSGCGSSVATVGCRRTARHP